MKSLVQAVKVLSVAFIQESAGNSGAYAIAESAYRLVTESNLSEDQFKDCLTFLDFVIQEGTRKQARQICQLIKEKKLLVNDPFKEIEL